MRVNRQRRKVLAASLMPAAIIGIPLAVLLISEMRSLGRLERATEDSLTQTSVRVAEELAREVRRDLRARYISLVNAIAPTTLQSGDLEAARQALEGANRNADTRIGALFLGTVGGLSATDSRADPAALSPASSSEGSGFPTAVAVGSGLRASVVPDLVTRLGPSLEAAVAARARAVSEQGEDSASGLLSTGGHRYLVAIQIRTFGTHPVRFRRFVAYAVDVAELSARYFPAMAARIRDSGWTFSTDQPVEVSIIDDRGLEVYRTGASLRVAYVHQAPLTLSFLPDDGPISHRSPWGAAPVWFVRAGYAGTSPAALARSSANQQRQVLFLVGLVATVGIVLAGRAIARELGLAGLKAEFVSSVSHDLKTPLASIQVLADVLRTAASMPSDKVKGYGEVIGSEARKLGSLIDGMLEFERINTGGRNYIIEAIDLRQPVREAVGEFATQLKEAGFTTELRLPADSIPFVGNAEALGHAVSNLVGNAIKYSDEARFLRVAVRVEHANAVIEVQDRGIGIHAGDRTKIFDRFYRVHRDAETDPAGTGLGLPIAQHVVRAHGGRISVAGRRGGGSVFTIELPLTRSDGAIAEAVAG